MKWRRRSTGDAEAAAAARARAELDLQRRVGVEGPRMRQLTAEWRRIREHNNIAAAFEASLRGGHQ